MPQKGNESKSGLFKRFDFFFKMEEDLMADPTVHGTLLSASAIVFMVILFCVELSAYMESKIETAVAMDSNRNSLIRINFNITLMDLSCDYATVDLLDNIGTNQQNVTKNIEKWQLDSEGNRRMYQGRNREQYAVGHDNHLHPDIEELHENGVHAIPIGDATFSEFVKKHEFSFVDFYAPWCIWCQRLEPTWEKFAEEVEDLGLPVQIVKVNCVEERETCTSQRVQAFPTLRFFKYGEPVTGADYRSDRTVGALMEFAKRKLELEDQYKQWPEARAAHAANWNPDHPGCMIVGFLMVNRVPGNFHIEARSINHNLNAAATNLSHVVNHMSFGNELSTDQVDRIENANVDLGSLKFSPLDNDVYTTEEQHQAFHHYIKVISTHYKLGTGWRNKMMAYQMLTTNQVMYYDEEDVPEAKFHYDISPMAVEIKKVHRHWYDFITSVLSIVGGTITVLGLIDGVIYSLLKPKKA